MVGTVLAQAIPVILLPILTRLVPPAELGSYFEWYSVSVVCAVIVTCSLDVAIYSAGKKQEITEIIHAVAGLAVYFFLLSCTVAAVMWISGLSSDLLNPFEVAAVGLYSGLAALTQCVIAAYVYDGRFKSQGYAKFCYAGLSALFQLVFVLLGAHVSNMIFGQLLGMFFSLAILSSINKYQVLYHAVQLSRKNVWNQLVKWNRFPRFSMPAQLIGAASAQLPIFFIGVKFGSEMVAQYGVALRSLAIPIGLLGGAVLTVFKREASEEYRERGCCRKAFATTLRNLVVLSVFPVLLILLFGEQLFTYGYGENFRQSAVFAKYILPSVISGFIASPLAFCLFIADKQHWDLVWQIALIIGVSLTFILNANVFSALVSYSIFYSFLYLIYIGMSWKAAKGR